MIYYRLTHFFITRQPEHFHWFTIGIYDSKEKAQAALDLLKTKPGFFLRPNAFRIRRIIRFKQPRGLNITYWADGFEIYTYKVRHKRKVRKKGRDYSAPGAYFITLCTDNKEPILWDEEAVVGCPPLSQIGSVVESIMLLIHENFPTMTVDQYCIMPDHIHMILSIHTDEDERQAAAPTLSMVVCYIMRAVSMQIGYPIWQALFVGRKIRNKKEYHAVWEYIENNPMKIDTADDIPDFKYM